MSDPFGFKQLDEQERIYAPEQLPADQQGRVQADEGAVAPVPNEPAAAGPVANLGNAPSAAMAPLQVPRAADTGNPDTDPIRQLDPDNQ